MHDYLEYLKNHAELTFQPQLSNKCLCYAIKLPELPYGREFQYAYLELPDGFPEIANAIVRLPSEKFFKIPHVEHDGKLCLKDGDPGVLSGCTPIERIDQLIDSFYYDFLGPWCNGLLDGDFRKEAQTYWSLYCSQQDQSRTHAKKIYVLNNKPHKPVYSAWYLTQNRILIEDSDAAEHAHPN